MDMLIGIVLLTIIVVAIISKIPSKPTFLLEGKILEKKYGFDGCNDSHIIIKTRNSEIVALRFETHDTSSCRHSDGATCFHAMPGPLCIHHFEAERICVRTFNDKGPERKVHSIVSIKYFDH